MNDGAIKTFEGQDFSIEIRSIELYVPLSEKRTTGPLTKAFIQYHMKNNSVDVFFSFVSNISSNHMS